MTSPSPPIQLSRGFDPRSMNRPEFLSLPAVSIFPGVTSHLGVQYAATLGFRPLSLDLHVPDNRPGGSVAAAIYAHGGGFLLGSPRMGPWRFLLEAGIAVVSISYRFSSEAVFPAQLHDVAAAIRFVRAEAPSYGIDPSRLIGFGSSAGAFLVSAAALIGEDLELLGNAGHAPEGSSALTAVLDHYGPTDILRVDEDAREDTMERMLVPGSTLAKLFGFEPSSKPAEADRARLTRYVSSTSPPFFIAHGDRDRRIGIEQSRRLHRALLDAGVRSELWVVPGGDHGTPEFDMPAIHEATLDFLRSIPSLGLSR